MRLLALLSVALFLPLPWSGPAFAAAWLQPKGSWQIITGVILSDADRSFDNRGHVAGTAPFQRVLLQTDSQYGLTRRMTLFARTESAYVRVRSGAAAPITVQDNAVEGGARFRLGQGLVLPYDVLSIEGSARAAGAFNFAFSATANSPGRDAGVRLLYGSGFKFLRRDAFVNLEAGMRWVSRPRPNQTPIDLTAGVWLNPRWMVMAQSFNLISGPAVPPYTYLRIHKLEGSLVWRFSRRFSLQAGAFFSPVGQNSLDERGLCLSLWANV